MTNFFDKKEIRELVKKLNFRAKKSFGQNFLVDRNVCQMIVSEASRNFSGGVLEVGSGLGTLSFFLAQKFKKVVSIEIDKYLFEFTSKNFDGIENIEFINDDVLGVDVQNLVKEKFQNCENIVVCSNLPYCITTPVLTKFLESRLFSKITVMVQKEAADRILASPGTRSCGAISSFVRYYSNPKFNFKVSNKCFFPSPKVESSVISFDILNKYNISDEQKLFKIIKSAFNERRKNILNSISSGMKISKEKMLEILQNCNINKNLRAENLTLENFIEIYEKFNLH